VRITIDRSQTTPVYLQIKGQLAHMIGLGIFKSNQKLPTIRQLANEIGVAPLTVVQALEAMAAEGIIETRPGVGSFVVELHPETLARSRREMIDKFVERSLDEASQFGVTGAELATAMWMKVFPGRKGGESGPSALFIGNYPDDTPLLAGQVAEAFASYGLVVHGRTIEELRDPSAETATILASVDLVIAVPLRFVEARRMLGDRLPVVGLPLTLSPSTREQLAQIHESTRLGMVVTETVFKQSIRGIVSIYRPSAGTAPVAMIDERQAVQDLIDQVDVVIYSMGIRDRIRPLLPRNILSIELTHIPDPAALNEIRTDIERIAAGEEEPATMSR
jgi:DNA-binding transcriptional regulator YhcF (GntR family)